MEHKGGATIIDPSGNSIEIPGGIVHDATKIMGKPFDSGVSSPTDGQILVYNSTSGEWETGSQSSSGGSSRWTEWTGAYRDGSGIRSTGTILPSYTPIRFRIYDSGSSLVGEYYAIVRIVSGSYHPLIGVPVATGTGYTYEYDYGVPEMVNLLHIIIPGEFAAVASTTLLKDYLSMDQGIYWATAGSYVVGYYAACGTADTSGTDPNLNVSVDGDQLCSYSSDNGLPISTAFIANGVYTNTANYKIEPLESIEVTTDANGGNNDAKDLSLVIIAVTP
jgi:hypothetical protein